MSAQALSAFNHMQVRVSRTCRWRPKPYDSRGIYNHCSPSKSSKVFHQAKSMIKKVATCFVAGSILPPVLTKLVLQPMYSPKPIFDEINALRTEMDQVGWIVRHEEESRGLSGDALYAPTSLYQGWH